jgi:hypothetical protein
VESGQAQEAMGLSYPASKLVLMDEAGVIQTLEFGIASESLQYVRIGTKDDVVKLYVSDLAVSELTPQDVMYIAPLDINVDQVQSVSIRADGVEDILALERNDEEVIATLNGVQIPYSSGFVPIYFKCITLNADGYDTGSTEPGRCEAVCMVTTINGQAIELALYERDDDTLYLYVNGQMITDGEARFYADRSSLTELLYRLQAVSGN